MFWLLQNNHVELLTGPVAIVLRQRGTPFLDFSLGSDLPEFDFDLKENYFFYGSTGLHKLACDEPSWRHAVLDVQENFDQRIWADNRADQMLNGKFDVMTFREFLDSSTDAPRFVRPIVDQKAFTGQVIVGEDFAELYKAKKGRIKEQKGDMLVAVSGVHDIVAEYRFIVRNNKPIVGSSYRVDGVANRSCDIPKDVYYAACEFAQGWMPASIAIMDVCKLRDGTFRIVEFNGIHGSGLYAIPPETFIDTVERHIHEG